MHWFLPLASTAVFAACSSYEGTAPDGSLPDGSVVDSGGGTPAGDAGPGTLDASTSSSSSSSSSGSVDGGTYELTAQESLFLAKINETRANLAPGASPALNPVVWDYSIGNGLRAWAGCTDTPPPLPPGSSTIYGGVDERMTAESLIQYMIDTRASYDLATNTCSTGGSSCEGYTNMVQRGVSRVACVFGSQICPPPLDGQNVSWRQWACTYAPLPEPSAKPY